MHKYSKPLGGHVNIQSMCSVFFFAGAKGVVKWMSENDQLLDKKLK